MMQNHDKSRFALFMTSLAEYYGKPITQASIGIYWDGLCHHDLAAIEDAITRHIRNPDNGQWMPKVSDIVRLVSGSTEESALQAWTKVDRAMSHIGPWRDVVFDDPIIHRVLFDMGGWILLGEKSAKDWPFLAREFMTRYRGYVSQGSLPDYEPVLTGMANLTNQANGNRLEQPALFGNAAQCLTVMAEGVNQTLLSHQITDIFPKLIREASRMAA
ncbi:Bacteriophage protein [Gammaproteobacteria bacterium]